MSDNSRSTGVPVIAIGASAGGLEACRALLKDLPKGMTAAFILVLHLDPSHDSMMVNLLADHTSLKVVQAKDGMALRPGHLHVIPPGVFLTVAQNCLHLSTPEDGQAVRMPFDVLLRSLAQDAGARAGCIVLSGTGTDGTKGSAEIHAAGGLVIAQDPDEASYSGMPQSAVSAGHVAHALPIGQMGAAVQDFLDDTATGAHPVPDKAATQPLPPSTDRYDNILAYLSKYAAQDLSLYKRGTLERRIARRMGLVGLGLGEMARYLGMLQADAEERAQLAADLLIHVTSFFRDKPVFTHLATKAIPDLVRDLPEGRPLRVWVAGCSTGEEAYSIAILCLEAMEAAKSDAQLQILASDIDPEAIAAARTGFYPKEIEADISPERLKRFFVPEKGGYRVTLALRDVIVFTVADLLSDPPFSKIDLVSCRNVLIYLGPEAQKRVIARCCFALRPRGLLLLGTAEMPGESDGCFASEDKDARLWRRIGHSHPADLQFSPPKHEEAASAPVSASGRNTALADLCRRIVLEHHAPAAVLLNQKLEVLYVLGPTEKYLTLTQGHPDTGVIGMLPKVLRARVRNAAATCTKDNPRVTVSGGRVSGAASFDITLHAISTEAEPMLLACFIDTPAAPSQPPSADATAQAVEDRIATLEAELDATRRDLSDALRDLEHEVEAHAVDTAESLSVNEEFQSTNEELLASKEELQSLNEELNALNSQLQETLERHRTTADDLQNVLYSTDVATLFLDLDLNIRFFTPAARAIFRVIPTDVGRPLADLASVSKDDNLAQDAMDVLASSEPKEREIESSDSTWFLRRIQPYRAEGGRVEGVVITYVDITERKRTNAALVTIMREADRATKAKSRFLAAASHDLRQPLQSLALLHKLQARHKPSTKGARLAALLDQTLNSMTAMLDSMLDVNRIQNGIVQPEMRPVSTAPMMKRLTEEFEPYCSLKGLQLRWVPCKTLVQTDPQLLEQILRNLLSNAVKYTPSGKILMGCKRHGDALRIYVCDTGIGIAKSETEAIFDAYHQVEITTALEDRGLGLGLSIVQRLARLMDHPISVRSTLGKGSTFTINVPLAAKGAEAEPALNAGSAQSDAQSKPQTGTILVVDDEARLRDLLSEVLSAEGHKVIAKATPKEALAWSRQNCILPDILLTDFDFRSSISGLELAQDLMRIWGISVPTLILTGDITSVTAQNISDSGFRHLVKPVAPEILTRLISDIITKTRSEKATELQTPEVRGTTVHLVDDDPMIRETMRRLFEAEGWKVVTYASAEDFLETPQPEKAACLLVDNHLPGMDGITLIEQLRARNSYLPMVMMTGHGDAALAVAALKAGASDLIEKPASAAELLGSVRQAMVTAKGGRALAGAREVAQQRFAELTTRERDVLARVLEGAPNKIIAADLGINQRTVENHRASVMRKTGATSLPDLVRLALAADTQGA
ncbi:two-component system CheB/CheR fusion protein [Roseinatronobacter thiooxidans]|uniref:histidine kinase n=2 Tax=Roseinatronobacter thiooxidans TaxID=121821 RepID=A0A2W7R5I6_9RHOB|nr:chemotaxis protein CheB [Roseinatronobacter thiooxidans]PZX45915.1 two-component system CheB/CheR fusion protein [Roseinatronobacter thiooxidans]